MAPIAELLSVGAVVPYGICMDSQNLIWVAAKGGLFRFDRQGRLVFADKHDNPKHIRSFSCVCCVWNEDGDEFILTKFAEEKSSDCFLNLHNLDGSRKRTSIHEISVKSIAASKSGKIFMTAGSGVNNNQILWTQVDNLFDTQILTSSQEISYHQLACDDQQQLLVVSTVKLPSNPYSEQSLIILNFEGQQLKSFSAKGTEDGQISWPRAMQINVSGNLIVLDRTGRLQEFQLDNGEFRRQVGYVSAGLANGFCMDNDSRILMVTCSGFVLIDDKDGVECNDWIESIPYD